MIKLVVLDLDGTLTDSQKKLPEANKVALMDLQKRGCKVALASGRPKFGIKHLAEQLCLPLYGGFVLAYNGGLVIDCTSGRVVSSRILPRNVVGQLRETAKELGVAIITYNDESDTILSEVAGNEWVEHEAWLNNQMKLNVVPNIDEVAPDALPKCLMVGNPDRMREVEPIVQERFPNLGVYRSSPFFLEVVPKGVDKAASIEELRMTLGIEVSEIAAFGDGYNDISMVKYAGVGVAMANGCDEIKQIADFVSCSNDECGVAFAIQQLKM